MAKSRRAPNLTTALRLVKSWLPAALVREMDQAILASNGAYEGRDDFIREAISDRLAEERARPERASAAVIRLHSTAKAAERRATDKSKGASTFFEPGHWSSRRVPTLAPTSSRGILYGLHNRDYPTLWAARWLLSMALERGDFPTWSDFCVRMLEAAWNVGAQLAKMDAERSAGEQKSSIGFPTNADKRQSAEARFLEHMVGVPDRVPSASGPIFAMKLAGVDHSGGVLVIAPTIHAVTLWDALESVGFAAKSRPPYEAAAWEIFSRHLRTHLPEDYDAWRRVLSAIRGQPSREELVRSFASDWAGAAAGTNVAGYVSRGREWGLIAPKLDDGRYGLTELGREVAEGDSK